MSFKVGDSVVFKADLVKAEALKQDPPLDGNGNPLGVSFNPRKYLVLGVNGGELLLERAEAGAGAKQSLSALAADCALLAE